MKNQNRSFLILMGMAVITASFANAETAGLTKEPVTAESAPREQLVAITSLQPKGIVETKSIDLKSTAVIVIQQPIKQKEIIRPVSQDELDKFSMSLAIDKDEVKLNGEISADCADRLMMKLSSVDAESKIEKGSEAPKSEDLKKFANTKKITISFRGTKEMPSLSDCIAADSEGATIDLNQKSKLTMSAFDDKELAVAMFGSKEIGKSLEYKLYESRFANCANCGLASLIKESSEHPLLAALLPQKREEAIKSYEASIASLEERISASTKESALKKLLDESSNLGAKIAKEEISEDAKSTLMDSLADRFDEIIVKEYDISKDGKSHSDFDRTNRFFATAWSKKAALPELGDDASTRSSEAKVKAEGYSKGGADALAYLKAWDPTNPIAVKADGLEKAADQKLLAQESDLRRDAQNQCRFGATARCNYAMSKLQTFESKNADGLQRANSVASMNQSVLGLGAWYQQNPAYVTSNANNLFTLNNSVFPNANLVNQNNGVTTAPTVSNQNLYQQSLGTSGVSASYQNLPIATPLSGISNQIPGMGLNAPAIQGYGVQNI